MNFLQLCQRAATECGVASNVAIQTALPTVVGATGSLGRIVNWVNDAWGDIETDQDDWDWMRSSNLLGAGCSFTTISGGASYRLGTGVGTVGIDPELFGKWDRETFRTYTTAAGTNDEMFLDEIAFDGWRDGYMLGAMRQVQSRPIVFAIGPDQSVNVGPPSNGLYTVTADYFVGPTDMVADADTPTGLPTRFHMLIVYRAMLKYAGYESAPEVFERGTRESDPMYRQLLSVRAPRISFSGALA